MPSDARSGSPRGFWAITSYFNLSKSPFRCANYATFRRHLQVPLLTVEFALDGDFDLTPGDAEILHQVTGGDVLWQKERLLNLALDRLPDECTHVAWVDCDVLFPSPEWATEAMRSLETSSLVQLYRTVSHLNRGVDEIRFDAGSVSHRQFGVVHRLVGGMSVDDAFVIDRHAGAMKGLAWAAATDTMSHLRFFDRCIIGGGDTALLAAACGCFEHVERLHAMNESQEQCYRRWVEPAHRRLQGAVSCIDVDIVHLWHGPMDARKSQSRHQGLTPFQFCPEKDIAIGTEGCSNWSSDKPEMHEYLRNYFRDRGD